MPKRGSLVYKRVVEPSAAHCQILTGKSAQLLLEAADQDCMTATPQYVLNFPLT